MRSRTGTPHFPSTQWPLIRRAGDAHSQVRRAALGEILSLYAKPLRAYLVLSRKMRRDEAEELVQAFCATKLVEQSLASKASQEKGKFRTLLLRVLDRFVIDAARDARALKRWKGALPLESAAQQSNGESQPCDVFENDWAREVLRQAVQRARATCCSSDRQHVWELLDARVVAPTLSGATPEPYETLAPRLGYASAAEASNALMTAKRIFARCLRAVVGEYLSDPSEIDVEIAELRSILAGTKRA